MLITSADLAAAIIKAQTVDPAGRCDHPFVQTDQRAEWLIGGTGWILSLDGTVQQRSGDIQRKPRIIGLLVRSRQAIGIIRRPRSHREDAARCRIDTDDGAGLAI